MHAGQVLARLDPTFAAADLGADAGQVANYQAQVARMQAEVQDKPFTYAGLDPNLSLQAAIYAQRKSQYDFTLENYKQKADSLVQPIARANSDAAGYRDRLAGGAERRANAPRPGEAAGRQPAEHVGGGGQPGRNGAQSGRTREEQAIGAQRDLAAMLAERDSFIQQWHADLADKLADAVSQADRPPVSRSKRTSCAGNWSSCAPIATPRC